jgi:hypothetical protein
MCNHSFAKLRFARSKINNWAHALSLPDLSAQGAEALCRPAFRFPAAPWANNNIAFGTLASQLFAELADFLRRNIDRELHLRGALCAGTQCQAHAHFCDVLPCWRNAVRVKSRGASFACRISISADTALRA